MTDQLGERGSKNDMVSTYIQKKEAGNTKAEASKKDRERKNSRGTSAQKVLEVEKSI